MRKPHGHPGIRGPRRGFTLVEILVVIVIISVIAAVILVAVNAAGTTGRQRADQATVQGLVVATEQFSQQFGFPPPLVQDGLQSASAGAMTVDPVLIPPVSSATPSSGEPIVTPPSSDRIRLAAVYNPGIQQNRRFLEGLPPGVGAPSIADTIARYEIGTPEWRDANQRYSKYALGYYLAGAMPAALDGVDGPGMVRPLADGTFEGVKADSADPLETGGRTTSRNRYDAFFDADRGSARLVREYFDIEEYRENAGDPELTIADPSTQTDWRHAAIVDSNDKAFRYYRWEPLSDGYGIATTATCQLNIPYVLLDDEALERLVSAGGGGAASIDVTGGDASLRGASWAIVGAGPDGLFGTEPIETLRDRLPTPETGNDEADYRALAKSDNVVGVGR